MSERPDDISQDVWDKAYAVASSYYSYYRCDDETRQSLTERIAGVINGVILDCAKVAADWSEWGQSSPTIDHMNGGLEASQAISDAISKRVPAISSHTEGAEQ